MPSRFAAFADRKSIAGSRLKQPVTMALMEAGIRQKADHPSVSLIRQRAPRSLQLLPKAIGRRMRAPELIFHRFPIRHGPFHLISISEVKRDRAIDLFKTQSRIMETDRFRGFPCAILPHDTIDRHTTPSQIEATLALFNELPVHGSSLPHTARPTSIPICGKISQ
jgi:hypothetical protein